MTQLSQAHWDALRPLVDVALELPPESRPAWLAEQRKTNPTLVAELEELLDREAEVDRAGFLSSRPGLEIAEPSSLAGQVLGAYVLDRPLGEGGQGRVWLARRADGRFAGAVAIKFLSLAVAGPVGEARFRREGSILAQLTHPNIARLLDAGVSPMGQPYLVLELVEGAPLDVWCDQRKLPVEGRLRLFQQVLAAVAHAHANLIVHRDLKPSNILVTGDGAVKLLDFGIAKLLDEAREHTALTASDERILTFEYAAPEQIRGAPISTATDVYSLGVVLYRLLAGRHPTNAECHTPAEHVRAVLETDPARLSDTVPDRLRRAYAGDLDNILAKALRKDPAERYPTIAALGDDLERYLRHEPVSARPATWSYRIRKFTRRNRAAVISAVLVAIALMGATAITWTQMVAARRERDAAIRNARRQEALTTVQKILASDSRGTDGRLLSAPERIELALTVLERTYRGEPWLVAEGTTALADRYFMTGDREAMGRIEARAQAIARKADLPAQLAQANCASVYALAYDGKLDSARALLAEAKAALARVESRSEDNAAVTCLDAEGDLLVEEGHPDAAVPLLTTALARVRADSGTGTFDQISRLQILQDLGNALRQSGRWREASSYHRQMFTELDNAGYGHTDFISAGVGWLVGDLTQLGEFALADSIVLGLMREQEAVHGAGHPSAETAFERGLVSLRMGQLDTAQVWLERAVHDSTASETGIPMWAPAAMTQLRLDQGRLADARREIRRLPTGTHMRQAAAALLGARLRWEEHDSGAAMVALEDSIRVLGGAGPKPPADLALLLVTAGEWRLAAGDARAADSLARRAGDAAAVDSLALTRSGMVGRAELLRARALRRLGDPHRARDAANRAVAALTSGFGPGNPLTRAAVALRDSLSR
ncbi:MAG: protein kinase domain-containing protein [Gemmatimonadales bacterium]